MLIHATIIDDSYSSDSPLINKLLYCYPNPYSQEDIEHQSKAIFQKNQ